MANRVSGRHMAEAAKGLDMRTSCASGTDGAIAHNPPTGVGLARSVVFLVLLALLAPASSWQLIAATAPQIEKATIESAAEARSIPDLTLTAPSAHDVWIINAISLRRSQVPLLMHMGDVAFAEEDFTTGILSGMQLYRLAALLSDDPRKPQHILTIRLTQAVANVRRDYDSGRRSDARAGAELLSYIDPSDERIKSLIAMTTISTLQTGRSPGSRVRSADSAHKASVPSGGDAFEEDRVKTDAVKKAWNDAQMATLGHVEERPIAIQSVPKEPISLPLPSPIKVGRHHVMHRRSASVNSDWAVKPPPPPPPPPPNDVIANSKGIQPGIQLEPPPALAQSTEQLSKEIKANAVYNTPPSMNIKETREIELFASVGKKSTELKSQVTAPGTIHEDEFFTADRVQAELTGQGFQVDPETPEEQLVGANNVVHWMWRVTPKETGHQQLRLVVSNIIKDAGSDVPNTVATFERYIDVNVTPWQRFSAFEQGNWQWETSTLVIPLVVWGWSRRKQANATRQAGEGKYQPRSKKGMA